MPAYSLQDTNATLAGPGGVINLGFGAQTAEENVSIEPTEDKNTMAVGGDGSVMHSLHSGNPGNMVFKFLKTSPTNALLMAMYNAQKQSSSLWGQNLIVVRHSASGDTHTGVECAFKKKPKVTYAKVGDMMEWAFDVGNLESVLGIY